MLRLYCPQRLFRANRPFYPYYITLLRDASEAGDNLPPCSLTGRMRRHEFTPLRLALPVTQYCHDAAKRWR
ncbi:hypothetical protein F4W66_24770 (plasmid) [Escherichia coli]|nr:hypothetical protein F4W66_24770 [Escherichia coli]